MREFLINLICTYTGWDQLLEWHAYSQWCLLSIIPCIIFHCFCYISRLIEYFRYDKETREYSVIPNFFCSTNTGEGEGMMFIVICSNIVGCLLGSIGFYIYTVGCVFGVLFLISAIITGKQYPF